MTKEDFFPVLYKKYKSKSDFKVFIDNLIERIKDNNPISDNGMLDGFIIGLIHANSVYLWAMIFTDSDLPPISDNQIQQLEQCIKWLLNNEEEINKI